MSRHDSSGELGANPRTKDNDMLALILYLDGIDCKIVLSTDREKLRALAVATIVANDLFDVPNGVTNGEIIDIVRGELEVHEHLLIEQCESADGYNLDALPDLLAAYKEADQLICENVGVLVDIDPQLASDAVLHLTTAIEKFEQQPPQEET